MNSLTNEYLFTAYCAYCIPYFTSAYVYQVGKQNYSLQSAITGYQVFSAYLSLQVLKYTIRILHLLTAYVYVKVFLVGKQLALAKFLLLTMDYKCQSIPTVRIKLSPSPTKPPIF